MIVGRPRESLVQFENPIEVSQTNNTQQNFRFREDKDNRIHLEKVSVSSDIFV